MYKKRFIILLYFLTTVTNGCVALPTHKKETQRINTQTPLCEYIFTRNVYGGKSFEGYRFKDLLIIKYNQPGISQLAIYNSTNNIMATIYDTTTTGVTFYKIINTDIKHIFNELISNTEKFKKSKNFNTLISNIFSGNIPFLTSSGKYKKKDIVQRVEGAVNYKLITDSGINLRNLRSYDVNKPNATIHTADIPNKDIFIQELSNMKRIEGFGESSNVIVKVEYIDESGFYNNEDLVSWQIVPSPNGEQLIVKLSNNSVDYEIEFKQQTLVVPLSQIDKPVLAKAIIKTKRFSWIEPNTIYCNNDISVKLNNVCFDEHNIMYGAHFAYDIENKSTNFINIRKISFHVGDAIIWWKSSFSIPPQSIQKEKLLSLIRQTKEQSLQLQINEKKTFNQFSLSIKEKEALIMEQLVTAVTHPVSRISAPETKITLGVSVEYEMNGQTFNMSSINLTPYSEIIPLVMQIKLLSTN